MNEFVSPDEKLITAKNAACLDEKEALASANKPGGTAKKWRYGIFFVIWLLVAWPMLTVRENIQIEHTIAIDSAHDKSREKFENKPMRRLHEHFLIRLFIVAFQQ